LTVLVAKNEVAMAWGEVTMAVSSQRLAWFVGKPALEHHKQHCSDASVMPALPMATAAAKYCAKYWIEPVALTIIVAMSKKSHIHQKCPRITARAFLKQVKL
jgi:hypothetical protein